MPRASQTRIGNHGQLIKNQEIGDKEDLDQPSHNGADHVIKKTRAVSSRVGKKTTSTVTRKRAALGDISNNAESGTGTGTGMGKGKVSVLKKAGTKTLVKTKTRMVTRATVKRSATSMQSSAIVPTKKPTVRATRKRSEMTTSSSSTSTRPQGREEMEDSETGRSRKRQKMACHTEEDNLTSQEDKDSEEQLLANKDSRGSGAHNETESNKHKIIGLPKVAPANIKQCVYEKMIKNIDSEVDCEPAFCAGLMREMEVFWREHEVKYWTKPTFLGEKGTQKEINASMRTILVDWLVEVCEEYTISPNTLFLCINLVDRSLAKFQITRSTLQLLGCACMLVASKYEEVYGPNIEEFIYITDNTYTAEDLLKMEQTVLRNLNFCITVTTPFTFLKRFQRAGCNTKQQEHLSEYLSQLALLDYQLLSYRPSKVAASIIFLVRIITNEVTLWTATLHHYTQYSSQELLECTQKIRLIHQKECKALRDSPANIKAITEKFNHSKFSYVPKLRFAEENEVFPVEL